MRNRSLKKQATMILAALSVFFIVLLLGLAYAYLRSSNTQFLRDLQNRTNQYTASLNRDILQATAQVERYFSQSTYYRKIASGKIPDYEWAKGVYHIKTDLDTQAATLPFTGGFFFFDRYRDRFFSAFHDYSESTLLLNAFLKDTARSSYTGRHYYGYENFQGNTFLVSYLSLNRHPLGYVLKLSDYFPVQDGMQMMFLIAETTEDENTYTPLVAFGDDLLTEDESIRILQNGETQSSCRGNLTTVTEISEFPGLFMLIVSDARTNSIWQQRAFWALLIFLPLSFLYLYVYFTRILKRTMLNPVTHLYNRLKQIQEQDGIAFSDEPEPIEEYRGINKQIDNMTQQMTTLREERLHEQIRTKEALLQYYQLQTNPHFFLSCLNTVSSLLECDREEIADQLIRALSSHFRYIFRASMTLVRLDEETKAVQDYCDISRIRSGFPILLDCEVSDDAMTFRIPLLAVTTFVENAVKHFGNPNNILTIRIQAAIIQENEERFLNLRITDNGKGYTEESLKESNADIDSYDFMPSHVGIRNLKYRMRLLYGDKAKWYFYNSPYGSAVAELKIPEAADERSDS